MNSIKKKRCVLSRSLLFILVGLTALLSSTCTTSSPIIEEHLCLDDHTFTHGEIVLCLEDHITGELLDEFVLYYTRYGLKIYEKDPIDPLNVYSFIFDHTQIHCLLFELLIYNDARVRWGYLHWNEYPQAWYPGYLQIYFNDHVTNDTIDEFVDDYVHYELKLFNVLIPKHKIYLFSYNHELISETDFARVLDQFDERVKGVDFDRTGYHKLIKPIWEEE